MPRKKRQHFRACVIFSGIWAVVPTGLVRRCHGDFLKEKGQITRLPKDATPNIVFFYTKTSSIFILIFIQKQTVAHNVTIWFLTALAVIETNYWKKLFSSFFFRAKRGRRPSGVSGIGLKKKKMDEKKRYHDRPTDDDHVFCTPLFGSRKVWKKLFFFGFEEFS